MVSVYVGFKRQHLTQGNQRFNNNKQHQVLQTQSDLTLCVLSKGGGEGKFRTLASFCRLNNIHTPTKLSCRDNKNASCTDHFVGINFVCHDNSALFYEATLRTCFKLEETKGAKSHNSYHPYGPPLYAVDSYVGLINFFGSEAFFTFLDSIKECYEALVIAKFLGLMYSYLNISLSKNIVPAEIKGREIHHSFPMTLFQPHTTHLDHHTLKLLKNWTWQFVVIRPVCSILMITLQYFEIYPNWVSWTITIILNISVSLALYSLVVFYHVFAKELEPHKPLAKFLCIKGIVFFCFWQGIVLELLAALGIIRSRFSWLSVERIEEGYQNILVCVEMVIFSAYQQYAYSAAPYRGDNKSSVPADKKSK